MDQTAQDRLNALVEICKQQKFRLPKPEVEEAASLLAQSMVVSLGPAYDTIDNFIRSLPVDSTARALRDSWERLGAETKNHLLKSLPNLPRSERFDRLKLLAAAAIADVDAQRGLSFLCAACGSLETKPGGHASGEALQLFRKTFIEAPEHRLGKLNITSHASAATGALLNIAMQSLFLQSNQGLALAPVFQLPFVLWLFRTQAYPRLKPTQQTQLVEAIKRWDTTLQLEVRDTLNSLSSGLPSGYEFLLNPPPKEVQQPPCVAKPVTPDPTLAQPQIQAFAWKDLLAELQRQIMKIDQDLLVAREESAAAKKENQNLKASLETAETHTHNLQAELAKKAQENEKNAEALAAALSAAAEAKQNAETLQAQISDLGRKHEEEVTILRSRVQTEAAQRLETFKHSLARVLRVDYADFRMTNGKPMTIELGQALHDLLAAIFEHLQKQGINAKD